MRKLALLLHQLNSSRAAQIARSQGRRIGRRGAFMAFLVFLDALYAYSLAVHLPGRAPNDPWAIVWAVAAANAACGIYTKRDRIQYGLAAGFKTAWGLYQFQQWVGGSNPLGWVSTVVWLGFAAIVLLISSWPEEFPPSSLPPPADVEQETGE
jgi:hypothetical protein